MPNKLFFVFQFIILSCIVHGHSLEVASLKCDHRSTPIGIDNTTPVFSWKIESREEQNVFQKSYHIQVASSETLLSNGEADMWDSGKIQSDNSIQVEYGGKQLQAKTRYFWQVQIVDKSGRTGHSDISYFETGLTEQADWNAKWISAPSVWDWRVFIKQRKNNQDDGSSPWDDCSPLFRKEFKLGREVKFARLYITGLGYYEAYLNGKRIGTSQLDPAFTRYDKTIFYSTYDVTGLLNSDNAIGIILGNGWYNMVSKTVWGFDHATWRGKPRAIMQLELTYEDGSSETIVTDQSWKSAPSPIIFNSVMQGMTYDASLEQKGWNEVGFDDQNWKNVVIAPSPGGQLKSQQIEPIRGYMEINPVKIIECGDKRYIVDFGQNIAGWAKIKIKGEKGDTVTLKYGEDIYEGRVDQRIIEKFTKGEVQTDKYILNDCDLNTFETKFTYHGFQYVEIEGYPGELRNEDIIAVAAGTDFKIRGTFRCSNEIVNKIQLNTLNSYRANFYGIPTDCPQREKKGWTGDAQLAVETGLWNFHTHNAYEKYLQDMADEQQEDGNLPAIIPTSGWGYHWGNTPAWIGAYIIIAWQVYLYDGDLQVLRDHYSGMKKLMGLFQSKSENNILDYGLGDWAFLNTKTPVSFTSTSYYYHFAHILSQVAELLNLEEDQNYYSCLAENIKLAFNKKFYKAQTGIYGNGSQTAQSCPLYMGLVEESEKQKVLGQLLKSIEKTDNHIDTGILGAKFLLHALSDNGHAKLAYEIVTNETFPSWAWWVKQGATTLWSHWDSKMTKSPESLNHIMFGDVSNWFYRNIAGIGQEKRSAGFKKIVIEPKLVNNLEWCNAEFESEYGVIRSSWYRENNRFKITVKIPCNSSATLILPSAIEGTITERGSPLKNKETFSISEGKVKIKLNPGVYSFEMDMLADSMSTN